MARPGSARCYGVARQREGSRQNSIGSPACFLSGISGWFSLSLGAWVPKKLARRRMQLWLMASAAPSASPRPDRNGAMLLDRLRAAGFRFNDFRAPRLSYLSPLARARALMARPWSARCYGVARQRDGSRQNSIGGPPRLPYLSPLARAMALMARPWSARCYGVARQRDGSRQNSIGGPPRLPYLSPLARARA